MITGGVARSQSGRVGVATTAGADPGAGDGAASGSAEETDDGAPMLRAEVPVRPVEYRARTRRDDAA